MVAARWVFGLGIQQLMAVWVLGSKIGLSSVGVGSVVMAWAAASRRDGSLLSLSRSHLSLSFFFFFLFSIFPSFLAFPFGFGFLLNTNCWVFFSFLHIYFLRFSWAFENSWAGRLG